MNKEQLQFFYDEIMGLFGWDDGDEASGVDPLLWVKKEYEIRNVKLAQLRAELDKKDTIISAYSRQYAGALAENDKLRQTIFLDEIGRPTRLWKLFDDLKQKDAALDSAPRPFGKTDSELAQAYRNWYTQGRIANLPAFSLSAHPQEEK